MASLAALADDIAERDQTEADARLRRRFKGRVITLAHDEAGYGQVGVHPSVAADLLGRGLLFECKSHDLHLSPSRNWVGEDVELLLIGIAKVNAP